MFIGIFMLSQSQDDDITKQIEELRNHPEALECISQDCSENLRKGKNIGHCKDTFDNLVALEWFYWDPFSLQQNPT